MSVVDLTDYVITKAPSPSSIPPQSLPHFPHPPHPRPLRSKPKLAKLGKTTLCPAQSPRPLLSSLQWYPALPHHQRSAPRLLCDSPAKTKRTKRINSHSQQAELVKKTHVTSPDTVEKDSGKAATPVSPRAKQEPEALPVKARAAEKQSIFEQPKMKRSAKDFDNLKVRGRI